MNRWLLLALAIAASFAAAFALLPHMANAEPHQHPPAHAQLHERFYSTWMRPDQPDLSCCNLHDCYPAEARNVGGTWFFKRREDGKRMAVPDAKIERNKDNPDGQNHVCAQRPGLSDLVFCFIVGGGM